MSIINVFTLYLSVIIMTLTGQAPVDIWFPLFEDFFSNAVNMIINLIS